ncbi:MAG: DUF1223 domain-containing protein, partial [Bacteroidia bacterium]
EFMKKYCCILLFVLLAMSGFAQKRLFPQALVEFYSSEGCENCPIADKFANEIINIADSFHQPVYVIDFHVDIWNRSGWVDPYSDSNYTKRQMKLAMLNQQASIFTPMVFINGEGALPGGAKREISSYIQSALKDERVHNLITYATLDFDKSSLKIDYDITGKTDSLMLNFALVKRSLVQEVTAGDNKGKTLTHHHIVRAFSSIVVNEAKGSYLMTIPRETMKLDEYLLISFLQRRYGSHVFAVDELLFRQ